MPESEQHWRREGLVFSPSGQRPWLHSHASAPVAVPLENSRHRVYFASRDAEERSHAAFIELDLDDPSGEITIPEQPALAPGPLGAFDDHGVYPTSVIRDGDRVLMFYSGFSPGRVEPLFYASIGVAASNDGGRTFERTSTAPAIGRSEVDPFLVTAPVVLHDRGRWRMWYVSGTGWERDADRQLGSRYHVKYAESDDGFEWRVDGKVCIDHEHPGERNVSRACVVPEGDGYRAWYSYGGDFPYRLGYASSPDGSDWTRHDDLVVLTPPAQDWDGDSQAYPWVFVHGGTRRMLYCGNDLGRGGFGLAVEAGQQ